MGRALEVVGGFVSNPGATLTALTASTGTSFTVRGTDTSKNTWLVGAWAFNPTAGAISIRSARLHDQTQGIRYRVPANLVFTRFPAPIAKSVAQRLYAQDNLTVLQSGGGAEIDTASILVYYEDLAGVAGRFIDASTLRKGALNFVTAEVTITGVTSGNFGGAVTINSTFDNLIANTDYAILGGQSDTRGCSVGITGVDLGNLRCGFPAEPSMAELTSSWFYDLADQLDMPMIPVINSANKGATTIDVQTSGAGGTFIVDLTLVQLAPGTAPQSSGTGPAAK